MKFRKSTTYSLVSECGRYSIAKVIVQGAVQYEAWHRQSNGSEVAIGVKQPNSEACMDICRRHRGKNAA